VHSFQKQPSYHANRSEQNTNIYFYGKFVDQSGNPVSGVKATAFVSGFEPDVEKHLKDEDAAIRKNIQVTSDANGLFSVQGELGQLLTIRNIHSSKYIFHESLPPVFNYNDSFGSTHRPDPNNPVIFKLYERSALPDLINIDDKGWLEDDGTF